MNIVSIAYTLAVLLGIAIGFSLARRTVKINFDDVEIEAPTMKEALALLDTVKRSREKR